MHRIDLTPLMTIDLALIGFGHVGQRFVELLCSEQEKLQETHGMTWCVVGIATRHHGLAADINGLDVKQALVNARNNDSLDTLHDASTGTHPKNPAGLIKYLASQKRQTTHPHRPLVVVETTTLDIQHGEPAIEYVRTALSVGAHVITTNKGPAAFAYRELVDYASSVGVSFLTEGAVLDGIPVFNFVRETLPGIKILGFRGVVNATTNQILTDMEAGLDGAAALTKMQAAGIAEADASLDVDGWDAAAKTAALINVLMEGRTTPHAIDRIGIGAVSTDAIQRAKHQRRRIKLVASAKQTTSDQVIGRVAPDELDFDDPLAQLHGMSNAVILTTDILGDIMIGELTSGLTQTAYALLSDLVTLRRRLTTTPET